MDGLNKCGNHRGERKWVNWVKKEEAEEHNSNNDSLTQNHCLQTKLKLFPTTKKPLFISANVLVQFPVQILDNVMTQNL